MGQRSQIYVRYNNRDKKGLIANYYNWNFGTRMISRARFGIENILEHLKYDDFYYTIKSNVTKLSRILDVNFDMKDLVISIDIIEEYNNWYAEENFNEYVFKMQDNNDGKLIIDICKDVVKYAFLNNNTDLDSIMDGEKYMRWQYGDEWRKNEFLSEEEVSICEENIEFISKNVVLMTKEEIEEFINYDYMNKEVFKGGNNMCKYFDINVTNGDGDSDSYSIFVIAEDEESALQKAINENLFEYEEDAKYVNYIDELTEEEYNAWKP